MLASLQMHRSAPLLPALARCEFVARTTSLPPIFTTTKRRMAVDAASQTVRHSMMATARRSRRYLADR